MRIEVCRRTRLPLLLAPLLVAVTMVACSLGGLGGTEAAPEVTINAPPSNSEVKLGDSIPIRATATDASGVTRIELWVDDTLYSSETSPLAQGQSPFSVAQEWRADVRGSHRVVAKAYNQAGSVGESAAIVLVVVERGPGAQATEAGPQPTQAGPQATQPGPQATQAGPQPTQPGPSPTATSTVPPVPPTHTPTPTNTPPSGPCLPSVVTTIPLAPPGSHPKGVAAQGHRVYVALNDQPLVAVIDADNNSQLPALNTHASGPKYGNAVLWLNGRIYVSNRDASSVSSINVSNPSDWNQIAVGSLPFGLASMGQYVYVANFGSNRVGRIDTSTDMYQSLVDVFNEPALLGSLPAGVFVPTNGLGRIYRLPPSGSPIAIGQDKEGYFAAAPNTNSGRVFVTNRLYNELLKIDGASNSVEATLHMPDSPYGLAVNPAKGRIFVVAAAANLLYVVDGPTMQIVGSKPVGAQDPSEGGQGIAVLANRIYVSNYHDGTVTVLDDSACP
jgi:YVTN family beta-propeller protein